MAKKTKYVTRERKVDSLTIVRKRVPLTPDTCKICGFSICEANSLLPYDKLEPRVRAEVKAALNKHKEIAHPNEGRHILSEEDRPTKWLRPVGNTGVQPTVTTEPREITREFED